MGQKSKVLKPKANNQGKGKGNGSAKKKTDRKVEYIGGINVRILNKHRGELLDPNNKKKPDPLKGRHRYKS